MSTSTHVGATVGVHVGANAGANVGVIGTGRMGTPIIGHLVKKGFSTVASDVNPERAAQVQQLGARWTQDNAALAAQPLRERLGRRRPIGGRPGR